MNKKAWKGSLVELRVIAELISRGYPVYSPFIQNGQADCIIETCEGFKKVQIKTARTKSRYKNYFAQIQSKNTKKNYSEHDIDYIICEGEGKFFVMSLKEFGDIDKFEISVNKYENKWELLSKPIDL